MINVIKDISFKIRHEAGEGRRMSVKSCGGQDWCDE